MPRSLPTPLVTQLTANAMAPALLVDIALTSGAAHVWSGVGSLVYNGNTYAGVGSLGVMGAVEEGAAVRADGTTLMLSGIDTGLLTDTLQDIQVGAAATVWLAVLSAGAVAAAVTIFGGTVDKPSIVAGAQSFSIEISLETRMANLQRATMRRYTLADQRNYYPDDTGFSWVEMLNDIALLWG